MRTGSPARCGVLLVLLVLQGLMGLPLSGFAETWYVSNRLGMKLEPIARFRVDEFAYVLLEAKEGARTVLTLIKAGSAGAPREPGAGPSGSPLQGIPPGAEEVTRWERQTVTGGAFEERVFERGVHVSTGSYGVDGRLLRETLYVDGVANEALAYRYAEGLLRGVESRSAAGELLWSTVYEVSPAGLLRGTRRTGVDPERAAFGFTDRRLQEETLESARHTVVLRYDGAGRRVVWEVFAEAALVRATYSSYDPQTGALAREEDRRSGGERTERTFDAGGHVVFEKVFLGDRPIAVIEHRYDAGGRRVATERRGEEGIELTTYGYDGAGAPAWEERRVRGSLRNRIVYTSATSRTEEIVQSDRLSLRVTYEGEEKVLEEVLRDSKVLRSRSFGEGP